MSLTYTKYAPAKSQGFNSAESSKAPFERARPCTPEGVYAREVKPCRVQCKNAISRSSSSQAPDCLRRSSPIPPDVEASHEPTDFSVRAKNFCFGNTGNRPTRCDDLIADNVIRDLHRRIHCAIK